MPAAVDIPCSDLRFFENTDHVGQLYGILMGQTLSSDILAPVHHRRLFKTAVARKRPPAALSTVSDPCPTVPRSAVQKPDGQNKGVPWNKN